MEDKVHEVITSKLEEAYSELLGLYGKDGGDIAPSEEIYLDWKEEELVEAVRKWLEAMPTAEELEERHLGKC